MKCLSIQIQPAAIPDFDLADFLYRIRAIGRSPEIDIFEEKGTPYANFNFFTEKPAILWRDLKDSVYAGDYGEYLKKISIVICEAERSDDDLLLHHFDVDVKVDYL